MIEKSIILNDSISSNKKYYKDKETKPGMILIDGGRTQLKFAASVIKASKHKDIKIISIVKGSDRVRATETILSEAEEKEYLKDTEAFDAKMTDLDWLLDPGRTYWILDGGII